MKAIISHTPEVATIDELTIELTDMSYGHDSRKWLLPNGQTSTLPTDQRHLPSRAAWTPWMYVWRYITTMAATTPP